MVWFVSAQVVAFVPDMLAVRSQREREKDIELLLLRQQLRIVERKHARTKRLSRREELSLVVSTAQLKTVATGGCGAGVGAGVGGGGVAGRGVGGDV